MARREIIADDLTGSELPAGTEIKPVKITFNGKSRDLDLSDASAAALADLVAGNGAGALARLLAKSDAGKSARARSGSRSAPSGDGAVKRAWLRANGYPGLAEKGKFSAEQNAAYEAHTLGATPGASRPAAPAAASPAA